MNIKIEKFEGPLGLLLRLIEKEEMDITQISLAGIANQYVDYIRGAIDIEPEEMADFLVIASKLLLIKSKALLPYLYPEEEEDLKDLERQLKMYKEFLEATKKIEKTLGKKKFMFAREFNRKVVLNTTNSFSPPKKLEKNDLATTFRDLLFRIKPPEKMKEGTITSKVTIEEKILKIQRMVLDKIRFSFNKILESTSSKTDVIVSFLAMLEMMRQREVVLDQDNMFGEIFISKKSNH